MSTDPVFVSTTISVALMLIGCLSYYDDQSFKNIPSHPRRTVFQGIWVVLFPLSVAIFLYPAAIAENTEQALRSYTAVYFLLLLTALILTKIASILKLRSAAPTSNSSEQPLESTTPSHKEEALTTTTPDPDKNVDDLDETQKRTLAKQSRPGYSPSDLWPTLIAAITGAFTATLLGMLLSPPVTIAIGSGAIVAVIAAFRASYPRFAATGGLYFYGSAIFFLLMSDSLSSAYFEDAFASILLLGTVSLAIVALQETGVIILRKVFGSNAGLIIAAWRAATAAIGAVLMVLFGGRLWRKALEYGTPTIGAPVFAGMDVVGIDLPAPLFFVDGVSAPVIGFVVCVAVGFHVLDTLYAVWNLAKKSASASVTGSKKGAAAASEAREKAEQFN